jgi:hypothetical protein
MKKSSPKKSATREKKPRSASQAKTSPQKKTTKRAVKKVDDSADQPIFAVAQDPGWIFCYWDPQLTATSDKNYFFRISLSGSSSVESESPVKSGSNSWYLKVQQAGAVYDIELGCYRGSRWRKLSVAQGIPTPRDTHESSWPVVFSNESPDDQFRKILATLQGETQSDEKLSGTISRLQREGRLPSINATPAQRAILDRLLESSQTRSGSSGLSSGHGLPSSWSGNLARASSWSSSGLARNPSSSWSERSRDFFLHVNAELIFYGGTHPQARVTIDGESVALQPDGTFRHHFIFPDGRYEVPIVATALDGSEKRYATLRFERFTETGGQVKASPQPPLEPPVGHKA